jgi:nucleotide-binding universal stress UspA family protein
MYKSILTYADGTVGQTQRLKVAAQLATTFGSHLIGTAACGGPELDFLIMGSAAMAILPGLDYEPLRMAARKALSDFDTEAARMDIESREQRLAETTLETALVLQSRYCDLVIASEAAPSPTYVLTTNDLASYLALHCARPVIVVPRNSATHTIGKRILIAWNGSAEASRAVSAALPMLRGANSIQIVVCNPEKSPGMHGQEPGADLAQYLARQNIVVTVKCIQTDDDVGVALHRKAHDTHADTIVAGIYGHSRLHELLLGGAARSLLTDMKVPVLLTH